MSARCPGSSWLKPRSSLACRMARPRATWGSTRRDTAATVPGGALPFHRVQLKLRWRRMKTCPECAEEVREAARLCRYCGHRFEGNESLGRRSGAAPQRRRRLAAAVAVGTVALVGGLVIGAGLSGEGADRRDDASTPGPTALASATPPRCSQGAVTIELERRKLLDRRDFSGVEQVACRDLTGDQIDDAIFVRASTGSAGTMGWGVLVGQKGGQWDPSLFRRAESGRRLSHHCIG